MANAKGHVAYQREIIERLRRHGSDTSLAFQLILTFETTLMSHMEDRDRLKEERRKLKIELGMGVSRVPTRAPKT